MSILNTVKQFLSGQRTSVVWADSPESTGSEVGHSSLPVIEWEATTGRLRHPQQERKLTYHNSEINGICTGKIGELTGSVMIGLFEDLPSWLPYLLIRVTVQADEGELTASLREGNGAIVSVSTPGTCEATTELINGRAWLRCESGPTPARQIRYEVVII
ncbi:hypothetical protein [Spirosoma areae]